MNGGGGGGGGGANNQTPGARSGAIRCTGEGGPWGQVILIQGMSSTLSLIEPFYLEDTVVQVKEWVEAYVGVPLPRVIIHAECFGQDDGPLLEEGRTLSFYDLKEHDPRCFRIRVPAEDNPVILTVTGQGVDDFTVPTMETATVGQLKEQIKDSLADTAVAVDGELKLKHVVDGHLNDTLLVDDEKTLIYYLITDGRTIQIL